MGSTQQLSLRWEKYQNNWGQYLASVVGNHLFSDVMVACDGQVFQLHRLVLASCSKYFETTLQHIPTKETPIVMLSEIAEEEMRALVQFMYSGQVTVEQSHLPALVKAAERLQIRGLVKIDPPPADSDAEPTPAAPAGDPPRQTDPGGGDGGGGAAAARQPAAAPAQQQGEDVTPSVDINSIASMLSTDASAGDEDLGRARLIPMPSLPVHTDPLPFSAAIAAAAAAAAAAACERPPSSMLPRSSHQLVNGEHCAGKAGFSNGGMDRLKSHAPMSGNGERRTASSEQPSSSGEHPLLQQRLSGAQPEGVSGDEPSAQILPGEPGWAEQEKFRGGPWTTDMLRNMTREQQEFVDNNHIVFTRPSQQQHHHQPPGMPGPGPIPPPPGDAGIPGDPLLPPQPGTLAYKYPSGSGPGPKTRNTHDSPHVRAALHRISAGVLTVAEASCQYDIPVPTLYLNMRRTGVKAKGRGSSAGVRKPRGVMCDEMRCALAEVQAGMTASRASRKYNITLPRLISWMRKMGIRSPHGRTSLPGSELSPAT